MLNYEKIGNFLQQLRIEKKYSQEDVAKLLFVTRQVISKWERGKSLPSNEMLVSICKLYNISVNELLIGERNNKENRKKFEHLSLDILKDGKLRRGKLVSKFIIFLFLLFILFLIYYFLSTYNQLKVYLITGKDNNFSINEGIMFKSNDVIYFSLGKLINYNQNTINSLKLYYIKENTEIEILTVQNDEINFHDYKKYNEYINFKDINIILNNLYLDIYYNDKYTDSIKLTLSKKYENSKLILENTPSISNEIIQKNEENEIPKNITSHFIFNEEEKKYTLHKIYDNYTIDAMYDPVSAEFSVTEEYDYYSITWTYIAFEEEDSYQLTVWHNNDSNPSQNYTYTVTDETICLLGDCPTSNEKEINYFINNYRNVYLID